MLMWPSAGRRRAVPFTRAYPGRENLLEDSEGAAQCSRRQPAKPTHKAITIDCPNLVKHDVASPTAEAARDPKFPMRTGRVFIAVTPFNVIPQ